VDNSRFAVDNVVENSREAVETGCAAIRLNLPLRRETGGILMRQPNKRVVLTGAGLIAAAIVFFLYFLSIASKSNDPKALMETVGQVSGVAGAIGVVMIVLGLRGRNPA